MPNHYYPWASFHNEFPVFVALFLFSAATLRYAGRGHVPIVVLLLFLVACIPLVQYSVGLIWFAGDAWMASFFLVALAVAYLSPNQFNDPARVRLYEFIAWLFLIAALVSLLLALLQWLRVVQALWLMDLAPGGRPYANLAQPNNLATLFCLGIVSTLYLREANRLGGMVTALVVAMLLVGVVVTQSRTSVLVALVLTTWFLWKRRTLGLRVTVGQFTGGLIAYAVLAWLLPRIPEWLLLGEAAGIAERGADSPARLLNWSLLWEAVTRAPWSGYGWGQVSVAQAMVVTDFADRMPTEQAEYSHNIVLDLLIWNGVPIGVALILGLAWWLMARMRQCRDRECWFGVAAILAVGVHALLEFPHAYAYFLLPIGVLAGALDGGARGRSLLAPVWLMPSLLVGMGIALALVFVDYLKVEEDHRLMRFQTARIGSTVTPGVAPDVRMLDHLAEYIRYARTEAREGMSGEEIEWMGKVSHRFPYPPALYRYALALGLNHRPEEAGRELLRLRQLHPEARIEEAREGWRALSVRYPQLQRVSVP